MFRMILAVLVIATAVPLTTAQQEAEKKGPDPLYPRVKMETSLGDIILALDAAKAPVTVDNFLHYVNDGFYNGTIFHRIIRKDPPRSIIDVIQGGGYLANMEKQGGLRGPIKNEWNNGLKNERGTISMARARAPHSATSQFFINTADNQSLDLPTRGAAYAVFGKVVEGLDVIDKIRNTELSQHPKMARMGKVVPAEPVIIKSVTLLDGLSYADVAALTKPAVEAAAKVLAEQARARDKAMAEADEKAQGRAKALKYLMTHKEDEKGNKLQKTDSGLMYVVLKEGDGPSPKSTDQVEVHYTGWLRDGKLFDTSHKGKGTPIAFPLNGVIKGWSEGVGMMKVGGKRLLLVPPELGYGKQGIPRIPPNSMLIFEIELLSIK